MLKFNPVTTRTTRVAEWVGVGFGLPKQFALYRLVYCRAAMQYIMCVLKLAVLVQCLPILAAYKQSNCTHYQQNIAIIPIHSTYSTRGYDIIHCIITRAHCTKLTKLSSMLHALSSPINEDSLKFFDSTKLLYTTR